MQFEGRFATGSAVFDADLRHFEVVQGEGAVWLYAVNGQNGGISRFRLREGQDPRRADSQLHRDAGLGTGEAVIDPAGAQLWLAGAQGGGLRSVSLRPDGSLSGQHLLDLPDQGGAVLDLAATDLGGVGVLYALCGDQLCGWRLGPDGGRLTQVDRRGAAADFDGLSGVDLKVVQMGNGPVLLLAQSGSVQGISSYRIGADGALQRLGHLDMETGLALGGITGVQAFQAHGQTWALVAAADSGALALCRVASDGTLALVDQLNDTSLTRFGGVTALKVVQVADRSAEAAVLVLAGGGDDGISLMRMLPGGRLVHLQSLPHEPGFGLVNVQAIEAVVLGRELQILVAPGMGEAGGSLFTLDLGDLGRSLSTSAVSPHLTGTAGADVLQAVVPGSDLTGGGGADVFLIAPVAGQVVIRDFTPGADQLDLSLWPGLRSLTALEISPRRDGLWLRHEDTTLRVLGAGGQPLELTDVFPGAGLPFPDRVQDVSPPEHGPLALMGTAAADSLRGAAGNDQLVGLGGADTLMGLSGGDTLMGGGGMDHLDGGPGRDRLFGGDGADLLMGSFGADRALGQAGADSLSGGRGPDSLKGGTGHDDLKGGMGRDRLGGGGGRDTLKGGPGDDRLVGGSQADLLEGNGGADSFVFGRSHGHDTIRDFTPGQDDLDLAPLGLRFQDLTLAAQNGGTLIRAPGSAMGSIWLEGVTPGALAVDDFLF